MTTSGGRPLRFFGLVMLGWITVRVTGFILPSLLPTGVPSGQTSTPSPMPTPPVAKVVTVLAQSRAPGSMSPFARTPRLLLPAQRARTGGNDGIAVDLIQFITATTDFAASHPVVGADQMASFATPPSLSPTPARTDRWKAGAWLLWRAGNGATGGPIAGSRLGGSQVGLRVDYELTPTARSRTVAYGRLSSALERPAAPEAAIGVAFQPFRAIAFSLAAERRIALGQGGRNANAVMAVGGFGPTMILPGVKAEGYAQAGLVGFRRRDGFIDGKISVLTPLPDTPIRVGAALSGGAQPGASRLDIGPEMQIRLPLRHMAARLGIEWRERIAGDARPDSGLAVTLAADF